MGVYNLTGTPLTFYSYMHQKNLIFFLPIIHDIAVLRESEHAEESVTVIGDKEYIDEEYVVTPRKKPRGQELKQEDKYFNRTRAAIENTNQNLKTYGILGGIYRGSIDDSRKITKIIEVIAALCNLNLNKHPIRR